jgi:tRNA-dihydrouridine synthase 2
LIGCIDYVDQDDGTLNLRVHPSEKPNLIIQIGSSDPVNAVKAALAVSQDAAGIDLNCGCPKRFSIVSAMGAALLSEPDRLCAILTALVENVPLPITAKIRMLETTEQTVELVRRIEKTGVSAITLHCR